MARKTNRTNALRLLEQAGVAFEVRRYDLAMDEFSASAVANLIDLPPSHVFKTLVAHGARSGHCLAVVPADSELDLKALAKARDDRKMSMVALKDVEPLTGYRRGSVTAIGVKRRLPVILDLSAAQCARIAVSGGAEGIQIVLTTDDYVAATGAQLAPLT